MSKARELLLNGYLEEALNAAQRAYSLSKNAREKLQALLIIFPSLLLLGKFKKAQKLLQGEIKAMSAELGSPLVFNVFKVHYYMALGENCLSLEIARKMAEEDPGTLPAYALALLRDGYPEAEEFYRSPEMKDDPEGATENLASLMIIQGRLAEAVEVLEELISNLIRKAHQRVLANSAVSLALAWSGLGDSARTLVYLELAEAVSARSQNLLTLPNVQALKSILLPELPFPKVDFPSLILKLLERFKDGDAAGAWELATKHCLRGLYRYYSWILPPGLREEAQALAEASSKSLCLPKLLTFGRPQLALGGEAHPLPRTRAGRVLLFLALHRGVSRDAAAQAFWGNSPRALRNYYKAVSELRAWLKGLGLEPKGREGIGVELWADALEFERLLRTAENLERMGNPAEATVIYRRLAQVYRGPFADGFRDKWVLERRESFRRRMRKVLAKLGDESLESELALRDPLLTSRA